MQLVNIIGKGGLPRKRELGTRPEIGKIRCKWKAVIGSESGKIP